MKKWASQRAQLNFLPELSLDHAGDFQKADSWPKLALGKLNMAPSSDNSEKKRKSPGDVLS